MSEKEEKKNIVCDNVYISWRKRDKGEEEEEKIRKEEKGKEEEEKKMSGERKMYLYGFFLPFACREEEEYIYVREKGAGKNKQTPCRKG